MSSSVYPVWSLFQCAPLPPQACPCHKPVVTVSVFMRSLSPVPSCVRGLHMYKPPQDTHKTTSGGGGAQPASVRSLRLAVGAGSFLCCVCGPKGREMQSGGCILNRLLSPRQHLAHTKRRAMLGWALPLAHTRTSGCLAQLPVVIETITQSTLQPKSMAAPRREQAGDGERLE